VLQELLRLDPVGLVELLHPVLVVLLGGVAVLDLAADGDAGGGAGQQRDEGQGEEAGAHAGRTIARNGTGCTASTRRPARGSRVTRRRPLWRSVLAELPVLEAAQGAGHRAAEKPRPRRKRASRARDFSSSSPSGWPRTRRSASTRQRAASPPGASASAAATAPRAEARVTPARRSRRSAARGPSLPGRSGRAPGPGVGLVIEVAQVLQPGQHRLGLGAELGLDEPGAHLGFGAGAAAR